MALKQNARVRRLTQNHMESTVNRRAALDALASTVVGTLATGLLTLLGAYFTASKGALVIGEKIATPGLASHWLVPIDIGNYKESSELELVLELPRSVDARAITTSRPVSISIDSAALGASGRMLLHVREIPARSITRLLVPIDSSKEASDVVARSTGATKFDVATDGNIQSPLSRAITSALGSLVMYSITLFLLSFAGFRLYLPKLDELKEESKSLNVRMEKIQAQRDRVDEEVVRVRKAMDSRFARFRILLLSRLSDLRRELDFWRDTLRTHAVQNGRTLAEADLLIEHIAKHLKTYTTLAKYPDIDSVRVASAMLQEGDAAIARDRSLSESREADA